jgi:hypothetical protein
VLDLQHRDDGTAGQKGGARVLSRVKRWVLAMLAREATGCAWLRGRRVQNAALLTRLAQPRLS